MREMTDFLGPHPYGEALFGQDSHSEEAVLAFSKVLEKEGQREPLRITPDNIILNGVVRWKAAKLLNWMDLQVIREPEPENLEYEVLRIAGESKRMNLREQTNVYKAWCSYLAAHGDIEDYKEVDAHTLTTLKIEAMHRAGMPYKRVRTADYLVAIFERGHAELQQGVIEGKSIRHAYALLTQEKVEFPGPSEEKQKEPLDGLDFLRSFFGAHAPTPSGLNTEEWLRKLRESLLVARFCIDQARPYEPDKVVEILLEELKPVLARFKPPIEDDLLQMAPLNWDYAVDKVWGHVQDIIHVLERLGLDDAEHLKNCGVEYLDKLFRFHKKAVTTSERRERSV